MRLCLLNADDPTALQGTQNLWRASFAKVKMKIVLLKKKVQYFHVSCSCKFCCERMNLLKAFSQFAIV